MGVAAGRLYTCSGIPATGTSSVDCESERLVRATLEKAARVGGRITIALTDRINTIQKADMIYCWRVEE